MIITHSRTFWWSMAHMLGPQGRGLRFDYSLSQATPPTHASPICHTVALQSAVVE